MERPLVHGGKILRIVFARQKDGLSPGEEFFDGLDDRDKVKLGVSFVKLADQGKIFNKQRFKKVEGTDFFEFKNHQIRMLCYFLPGGFVVITHGFRKQGDKIPKAEIQRANRIRQEDVELEKSKQRRRKEDEI